AWGRRPLWSKDRRPRLGRRTSLGRSPSLGAGELGRGHRAALGGPVLSAAGQLLGINTNRLGEGFYLAIPADEALRGRAGTLARGESAQSPRLGVAIAPNFVARRLRRAVGLPETDGLLIRDVADDSPAARAGLAQGDLIVAASGHPIATPDDLFDALQATRGGTIALTIIR